MFGTVDVHSVRQSRQTPPAATAGVWHVASRNDRAVLKVVCHGGDEGRWPARAGETDPYYWRREPLAYVSGVNAPFGVPTVRACVERPDGTIALWLDDRGEAPSRRTPEAFEAIAESLGRAQRAPVPAEPWLGGGFLREYLRLHGIRADCSHLEALPQVLCHNDFHPGNILGAGDVIDWAYCGIGAAGLDAGVLVVDALADGAVAIESADDVAEAVWAGYRRGFGEDVQPGFVEGARRLRWLPRGRKPEWDATLDLIERLASER